MPTAAKDPYDLKLSKELTASLDAAVIRRVIDVVSNCQDRDDELVELHLILEGISMPTGSQPWPNACELEASLCREYHTTLNATLSASSKQFPYVITEPSEPNEDDAASQYERWVNVKVQQDGYEDFIDDIIYTALESKYAPAYIGYTQDLVKSFEMGYREPDWPEGQFIPADLKESGKEYHEQLMVREDVRKEGLDFRSILPWNLYVDPIDAPGPQIKHDCARVIERIAMTRDRLMAGVRDFGYDKDAVMDMLAMGPTQQNQHRKEMNDDQGLQNVGDYWECFQVIGRLPYLGTADDDEVPERLRYIDFVWLVCPDHNIAFKRTFSPFPLSIRPYVSFCAFHKPGFMLGNGLVSLLRDLQNEMTALERFGINKLNLEATPMMSVPERWLTKYSKWKVAPGRMMPRVSDNPHELVPVTWDAGTQNYIMAWMDKLDAYGSRIAAAQSANSTLAGKVRKATEVQFADAMMQTKFDLIQSNINRGVRETFEIVAALLAQHADGSETMPAPDGSGKPIPITLETLRQNFRFIPQANADGANSSLRLQKDMVVQQIVMNNPVYLQEISSGNLVPAWVLAHRMLTHAGWRSPEELIGPDPRLNPGSLQGGQQQPQAKYAVSINYKDLPPDAKLAAQQEVGLPASQPPPPDQQGGTMENPEVAAIQGQTDLVKQQRDHHHELNLELLKQHHEKQLKAMDLQGKLQAEQMKAQTQQQSQQFQMQQSAQDHAFEAAQGERDRMHQSEEGQANREHQAKLRPVGKTNGTGGKSNGAAISKR